MKAKTMASRSWMVAMVAILMVAGASTSHGAALNSKTEVKCFDALSKASSKHMAAVAKAMAACRAGLIAGSVPAITGCPDAIAQAAIDKSAGSVGKAIVKKCKSTCSVSGLECIDDIFCPPNGATPENCTAGAKGLPFHSAVMGFPGAGCEAVLASKMSKSADFSECMVDLGQANAERVLDLIFGSLDNTTTISADALKCVEAIAKALPKSATKNAGSVSKCRTTQLGADPAAISADACAFDDLKTSESLAKNQKKLDDTLDKSCTNATIQELDLCGKGQGAVTSVADAKTCLDDVLAESSYSIENSEDRQYVVTSLINVAYPDTMKARCGDNIVNQIPSQFFRIGEECDGTDDSACPDECFPPGDLYQCTCKNTPRVQTYADGATADLDNGWSGSSHNSQVTQGAGFYTNILPGTCNCSQFGSTNADQATCTGTTSDPICDLFGAMGPRCNWAPYDGTTCDAHGNNNGVQTDTDCAKCDEFSGNAGAYCVNEDDCDSFCYSPEGVKGAACTKQSNCTEPDVCKGRCDNRTTSCNVLRNGAPLPLSSQGTSVCVDVRYFTDVTGTKNMVTGESEVNFDQKSVTFLAQSSSRPCPICGGFCTAPGAKIGEICEGTCTGTGTECRGGVNKGTACTGDGDCPGSKCQGIACRFDDDCPGGETCGTASPECMGEKCQLALLCAGGDRNGRACRIEAATAFGTTSVDCPPPVATNISGAGLHISYTPLTSEAVALENPGTCDTPGFKNLDGCFCVTGGGSTRNQPNRCAPACNAAGPRYGAPCGGNYSTCVAGAEAGAVCDGPGDCSGGGTCTGNPTVCLGGTNDDAACTSDADCTGGGTCGNACAGGLCVPLCEEKGKCSAGSTNPGAGCSVNYGCPGGTCDVTDSEEGLCAAGPPLYHCNGVGHEFRTCLPEFEGTPNSCEAGIDQILGTDDDNVGAGICVADARACFVNNGAAEGGDTLNGKGDPTHTKSVTVFCIPASSSNSVNATAGMPGPARLRERSLSVPNFTHLP